MGIFKKYSDLQASDPLSTLQKMNERIVAEQERQRSEKLRVEKETEQMIADLNAYLLKVQCELESRRFLKNDGGLILPDEQTVKGSIKVLRDLVHTTYLTIIEAVVTNIIKDPQYEHKDGIYDILNLPVENAELEDMMEFISVINKDRPAIVSKYYECHIADTSYSIGDLAGNVYKLFMAK